MIESSKPQVELVPPEKAGEVVGVGIRYKKHYVKLYKPGTSSGFQKDNRDKAGEVVGVSGRYKKHYAKMQGTRTDLTSGTGSGSDARDKAGEVVGVSGRYKKHYSVFAKQRMSLGGKGQELVPDLQARDKAGEVVGVGIRYKKYYSQLYPQGKHHLEPVPRDDKDVSARDRAGEVVGVRTVSSISELRLRKIIGSFDNIKRKFGYENGTVLCVEVLGRLTLNTGKQDG